MRRSQRDYQEKRRPARQEGQLNRKNLRRSISSSAGALLPLGVPQVMVIAERDEGFKHLGRSYAATAKAAGDAQLRIVDTPGAGHFDVVGPVTPTWLLVTRALSELSALVQ